MLIFDNLLGFFAVLIFARTSQQLLTMVTCNAYTLIIRMIIGNNLTVRAMYIACLPSQQIISEHAKNSSKTHANGLLLDHAVGNRAMCIIFL